MRSHLEHELRQQPAALARLIQKQRGYVVTHGGSRVSYEALADRLLEPSAVSA